MSVLKNIQNIKRISEQISSLPKLYNSHVWITPPSSNGLSFIGISEYSRKYLTRLGSVNIDSFFKTNYGIVNREYIKGFIQQHRQQKQSGKLRLSLQKQWQRFQIKQNQAFCILQAIQFDIELKAPVDLRVVEFNFDIEYNGQFLSAPYYFMAQILNPSQLNLLSNEQQYNNQTKMLFF